MAASGGNILASEKPVGFTFGDSRGLCDRLPVGELFRLVEVLA